MKVILPDTKESHRGVACHLGIRWRVVLHGGAVVVAARVRGLSNGESEKVSSIAPSPQQMVEWLVFMPLAMRGLVERWDSGSFPFLWTHGNFELRRSIRAFDVRWTVGRAPAGPGTAAGASDATPWYPLLTNTGDFILAISTGTWLA